MPISRNQVRQLCSPEEFEVYLASLRLRLPELPMADLHSYITRAREFIDAAKAKKAGGADPVPRPLRKSTLLRGALTRFEGRLRTLTEQRDAGRRIDKR